MILQIMMPWIRPQIHDQLHRHDRTRLLLPVVIVAVLSLLDIAISAWAAWVVLCLCLSSFWCFLLLLLFLLVVSMFLEHRT